MNIHRNHLFHSIAICLLSVMTLFTSCDKTDNVTGGIDSPDENTQYLLQPPTISIEPFGGGSSATRSAVAIEEERQAFNIGDELGNIITLGNSEVEDTPQTRALANNTYYRIVIYKLDEWKKTSPNILAQRLCKTGSSAYLADAGDVTTPIYLYPGDYRIFCYSFNKTSYTKLTPLADGATNVPLSDEDDFLSSDIIEKSISSSQLGTSVALGTITLKHRCCRLIGTLSTAAFSSAGINATPKPSLSVTSSFYTAANWSIKDTNFSGTTASATKTITISQIGDTYSGSLIVPPPSSQSLSASYNFKPNGGQAISVSNKPITTGTTFSSGGSYSFTIQAVGAYVLTETEAVKIGSHTWAKANLNGTTKQQESKPWISGHLTGSGIPSASGSTTASSTTNDWWRWNVPDIDTESSEGDKEDTWNISNNPCRSGLGGSWIVPPKTYFDDLVATYKLVNKRVYINEETMTTNGYGWVKGKNTVGCVFADTNLGTCIFLPAAGYRDGSGYLSVGTRGDYWSATLTASNTDLAYRLYFDSGYCYVNGYYRNNGRSLRCAQ